MKPTQNHDEDADFDRVRQYGEVDLDGDVLRHLATLSAAVPDLEDDSTGRGTRRARRASAIAVLVIAGAVGGGLIAVPAAAGIKWAAQTGVFGDPETSTEVDDTEWIDLGGNGASDVIAEAYPEYLELPPGVVARDLIAGVRGVFAGLPPGRVQEGTFVTTYESWAICAWQGEWLTAFDVGDGARADRAARWLSDPGNFPSTRAHDGGGVIDVLLTFAKAATEGDRAGVERGYEFNSCERIGGGRG
jgi:hypothetical protein